VFLSVIQGILNVDTDVKVKGGSMRIGELSRRTGLNAHQLRYYESQGLLQPERRLNGYRDYGPDAVLTVIQIKNLLRAGLSTTDIAYLLPCADGETSEFEYCGELIDTLQARLDGLEQQLQSLTRSRDTLRDYLDKADLNRPEEAVG
jgi:DNA-binding transcriptional MerR regulator